MYFTLRLVRHISAGLVIACIVAVAGCDQSPSVSAEKTVSPAASSVVSNVAVKGDETLPPNHPPLPSASPPHPTNSADNPTNLNQQLASMHPRQAGKNKLSVEIPASVKEKWASATLAVTLDDGPEKKLKLAIGETVSLAKTLQLHLVHFLPAYTSDSQTVTSSSNKLANPAVQIQSILNGQVVAEGWVFQNFPDFNSFTNEKIKVRLISAERIRKK